MLNPKKVWFRLCSRLVIRRSSLVMIGNEGVHAAVLIATCVESYLSHLHGSSGLRWLELGHRRYLHLS